MLPLGFFAKGGEALARDLLGKVLAANVRGVRRRARITETEAYVGEHDGASHARFGPTARNRSMYGPPGRADVYLVYG
ncbi:MAG TPA: DNA-3-methyladenine glycosylase, partial [Candidatus Thermoplasmatota archaeon]|nr:DNA-3-methyladenine glycosylase [Candidatus Thermoplasmatota archaeon]